jgi:hypothetical protein
VHAAACRNGKKTTSTTTALLLRHCAHIRVRCLHSYSTSKGQVQHVRPGGLCHTSLSTPQLHALVLLQWLSCDGSCCCCCCCCCCPHMYMHALLLLLLLLLPSHVHACTAAAAAAAATCTCAAGVPPWR